MLGRGRPVDSEGGVVPTGAPFGVGGIETVHLVQHLGSVGQGEEAVGHPRRDEHCPVVVGAEPDADMLEVARRFGPEVYDHVEDGPAGTPYELALSSDPNGAGALEPLSGFMTNPAGASIVNALGPIRQLVQGGGATPRRYLVIASGTPDHVGPPVQVQR